MCSSDLEHAGRQTGRIHPATRAFQAIRIVINDELGALERALEQCIDLLGVGGRLAVISFHSLEDRIVKQAFRTAATGGCECPSGLPCGCGARPSARIVRPEKRTPGATELERNPRAASARLRVVEKLPGGGK